MTRPTLPFRHANPKISSLLSNGLVPPVKFQILNCQGQDILVGRLKIETPTPTGHAFILRRYDTGAVSLTTMFRAAFPTASDEEEKREAAYIKETYDLSGNNGSSKDTTVTRLAGTWVSPEVAEHIGREYKLDALISAIIEAKPDPTGNYRRSGRGAAGSDVKNSPVPTPPPSAPVMTAASINTVTVTATTQATTTSVKPPSRTAATKPVLTTLPPAKRRKESSPAPQNQRLTVSPAPSARPTRRSNRIAKSPQPQVATAPSSPSSTKTPRKITRVKETVTPGGSDQTAVEEEGEGVDDVVAGSELHKQDIAEQKQMIADLKAQRDAALMEASQETIGDAEPSASKLKRTLEETDDRLTFQPKEPEIGDRQIATNRRVSRFHLEPQQKSFAWGVAAFAVGLGAVTFLPSLF